MGKGEFTESEASLLDRVGSLLFTNVSGRSKDADDFSIWISIYRGIVKYRRKMPIPVLDLKRIVPNCTLMKYAPIPVVGGLRFGEIARKITADKLFP